MHDLHLPLDHPEHFVSLSQAVPCDHMPCFCYACPAVQSLVCNYPSPSPALIIALYLHLLITPPSCPLDSIIFRDRRLPHVFAFEKHDCRSFLTKQSKSTMHSMYISTAVLLKIPTHTLDQIEHSGESWNRYPSSQSQSKILLSRANANKGT